MKLVAFDLGNVICHVDFDSFLQTLVDMDIVSDKFTGNELMKYIQRPIDLGEYSIKQFFAEKYSKLNYRSVQLLHDTWIGMAHPSVVMLDLINELIENYGYEVSLLSNIGIDHANILREKCPVFKKCNQHFSCDVGAAKPTKLFYQSFVLQYGWDPSVLFFDDREENVKAAQGFLNGVLFNIEKFDSDELAAQSIRNSLGL